MQPPYLYLTLWDDATEHVGAKLARIHERAIDQNAVAVERLEDYARYTGYSAMSPVGDPVYVSARDDPAGGMLIEIQTSLGELDHGPTLALRPLLHELLATVDLLKPKLALVTVEAIVDSVSDLPWPEAEHLIGTGWVNLERCSASQRESFDVLRQRGLAIPVKSGLWWSSWDVLRIEKTQDPADNHANLAGAAYEAWTGRIVSNDSLPARPSVPIAAEPELRFWRPDLSDNVFQQLIDQAASGTDLQLDVEWDDYGPGWHTGVTMLEPRASLTQQTLADFNRAIEIIRPAWATVLSTGTDWPLGVFKESANGSLGPPVSDLWVDKQWAHEIVPDLDRLFQGAFREETDTGILWITTQSLSPDSSIATGRKDKATNFDTEMEIAATLGRQVRRTIVDMYGPQPGLTEASIQE